MKYRKYQNIFWATLTIALVVDSSFDLLALKQTRATDDSGKAIVHAYNVLNELSAMNGALRENLQARVNRNLSSEQESLADLKNHFAKYRTLTELEPRQQKIFSSFLFLFEPSVSASTLKDTETQFDLIASAIARARVTEEQHLEQRLEIDRQVNQTAKYQIILASVFDFFLLLTVGLVWIYYDRSRKKEKQLLSSAIESSQESIKELEELISKRKQELRSTIHDLKNPLGSIRGFSDLIEEERYNPASVAEMSHILQRVSTHTLELVNSLVETESKKEKSKEQLALVPVILELENVCLSLKPQILQKRQSLTMDHAVDKSLYVQGDKKKIWDLFANLIGNAIKFTPTEGLIQIRTYESNGCLRIEIEDSGPGFTDGDKTKAFGEFQRLSAQPTANESSTGLGLYIVKNIVKEFKGSVEIKSTYPDKGACVVVELPLLAH